MICSVRKATEKEKRDLTAYAEDLRKQGHEVLCPITDTNQTDDIGLRIVEEHEKEIVWADEIHIIWNPDSEGSLWNAAQARMAKRFMPEKKIIVVNLAHVEPTDNKSYTNVILATHFGLTPPTTLADLNKRMPKRKAKTPQKITKKITLWQCGICKTKYKTETHARLCQDRFLEKKKFAVGDRVTNKERRVCSKTNTQYTFTGTVISIQGPEPADGEYERKWLGEKRERLNSHVFSYEVEYRCPQCNKKKSALYYAPELEKI